MSVLSRLFAGHNPCCVPTVDKVIRVDYQKGDKLPVVTFVDEDYNAIVKENGVAADWSLSTLVKAGIDYRFPVHTSPNSRGDELSSLDELAQKVHQEVESFTSENIQSNEE